MSFARVLGVTWLHPGYALQSVHNDSCTRQPYRFAGMEKLEPATLLLMNCLS